MKLLNKLKISTIVSSAQAITRLRLWLLLVLGLVALFVGRVLPNVSFETNLLALLPPAQSNPLIDRALDRFADQLGRRAVFLVGSPDFSDAASASERFAAQLRASPAFTDVRLKVDRDALARFNQVYLAHRSGLLRERDRDLLVAGQEEALLAAARQALYTPAAFTRRSSGGDDPLNLFGNFLAGATPPLGSLELRDGLLVAKSAAKPSFQYVLVTAALRNSPFSTEEQTDAARGLQAAMEEVRRSGVDVVGSGIIMHAVAAATIARRETILFGALQLLSLAITLVLVFHSPRMLLLSALTLVVGLLSAITACYFAFGRIHVMTLIFCGNLVGIAVDYSIYFCADQFRAPGNWSAEEGRVRMAPVLTISCIATLVSYALLAVAPFPGLRQMALFCCVGLAAAYLSVIWVFPKLMRPGAVLPMARRAALFTKLDAFRDRHLSASLRVLVSIAIGGLLLGLSHLKFVDDVRVLQPSTPDLVQQEIQVRSALGVVPDSRFILVTGPSAEAVLQQEEAIEPLLAQLRDDHRLGSYTSIAHALPSASRQTNNRALLASTVYNANGLLSRFMRELGFPDAVISQRLREFSPDAELLNPQAWLSSSAADAYRHLWLGDIGSGVMATVVTLVDVRDPVSVRAKFAGIPGVQFVDRVADISEVLGRYRRVALAIVAASILAAGVLFALRFGFASGFRLVLAPSLAVLATFSCYGWIGLPVTFFHVVALHLVFGLAVEYSLLLGLVELRGPAAVLSVCLASGLALTAFGSLALSRVPFIHSLGMTTAVGIFWGVLFAALFGVPRSRTKMTS